MTGRTLLAAALIVAGGCAAMPARSTDSARRIDGIAAKIREAEGLGARDCAPRDLAKAQLALDHVRHEVEEGYYPPGWMEPALAAADMAAETLLNERRLAAHLGTRFRCVSASGECPAEGVPPEDR